MKHFPIVKILRSKSRLGVARARIRGALAAKGKTLTFLDSHVEVMEGWLEPLLDRVARRHSTIVSPLVDRIHDDTFELISQTYMDKVFVGGFTWSLDFDWYPLPNKKLKARDEPTNPIQTPTIAGGLFSVNRAFFKKLGMYDPNYEIWGSENLELSFKTWMCGGRLEIVPCSRVGHVYRHKSPFNIDPSIIANNKRRLAAAWLDDYAKHFQLASGIKMNESIDVSDQLKLRKKLQCESFDWYLKHVYPEMPRPDTLFAYGEVSEPELDFVLLFCLI